MLLQSCLLKWLGSWGYKAIRRASSGAAFESPAKRYKASRVRIVVDDFDTDGIRRTIHKFYERKR